MKNIFLIGMPGCGKSTLGKMVAVKTKRNFYDADDELEQYYQMKITDIFNKHGEDAFRQMETETIQRLSLLHNSIIATGGGAVTRSINMEIAKKNDLVVFIDRPVKSILSDIVTEHRPLLADDAERLLQLYRDRIDLYRMYADIIIENTKTPELVINAIIEGVRTYENHDN